MPDGLSMPLVSIIIPHYNGENIIRECLKSLQNISYDNVEIIVVDNNSNDNSTEIIHNETPDCLRNSIPKAVNRKSRLLPLISFR